LKALQVVPATTVPSVACTNLTGDIANTVDACTCGSATCKKGEFCNGTACSAVASPRLITKEEVNEAQKLLDTARANELASLLNYINLLKTNPNALKTD